MRAIALNGIPKPEPMLARERRRAPMVPAGHTITIHEDAGYLASVLERTKRDMSQRVGEALAEMVEKELYGTARRAS